MGDADEVGQVDDMTQHIAQPVHIPHYRPVFLHRRSSEDLVHDGADLPDRVRGEGVEAIGAGEVSILKETLGSGVFVRPAPMGEVAPEARRVEDLS